jgi:type I restriction enzyme, R subunit
VKTIAAALETKDTIPEVRSQMELIQEIQTDDWWQDIPIPLLERARKRLRLLVRHIEKTQRQPIYTHFLDEMGTETPIDLPGFVGSSTEFDRFRAKARQFLLAHESHITLHKLRHNEPLTPSDLSELERMLLESGGTPDHLAYAKQTSQSLGIFIRSLVGLDREAAKLAFGTFLSGSMVSAAQIEFINLIIDYLTHHGIMEPGLLYESPFIDINANGPEGVFNPAQVDALISRLAEIRATAA